jgi:hypothetical protein
MDETGVGKTSTFEIAAHVQSVLDSGAADPMVGIGIGRFVINPLEDRTVIGDPSGPNPPTLVIGYSMAASAPPKTPGPTRTPKPTPHPTPAAAPTPEPALTPTPPPPPVVTPSAPPAASAPAVTPTPVPAPPVAPISGNRADWIPPLGILLLVVSGLAGVLLVRHGRRRRRPS